MSDQPAKIRMTLTEATGGQTISRERESGSSHREVELALVSLAVLLVGFSQPIAAAMAEPPLGARNPTTRLATALPTPTGAGPGSNSAVPPKSPSVQPCSARGPDHQGGIAPNGSITIEPNGSISNSSGAISELGATYTLQRNLSQVIIDERNGSIINGAGYSLTWTGPANDSPPYLVEASNLTGLTIENLSINDTVHITDPLENPPITGSALLEMINVSNATIRGVAAEGPPSTRVYYTGFEAIDSSNLLFASDSTGVTPNLLYGVAVYRGSGVSLDRDVLRASLLSPYYPNAEPFPTAFYVNGCRGPATVQSSSFTGAEGASLSGLSGVSFSSDHWGFANGTALVASNIENFSDRLDNFSSSGLVGQLTLINSSNILVSDDNLARAKTQSLFLFRVSNATVQADNLSGSGAVSASVGSSSQVVVEEDTFFGGGPGSVGLSLSSSSNVTIESDTGAGVGTAILGSDLTGLVVENDSVPSVIEGAVSLSGVGEGRIIGNSFPGPSTSPNGSAFLLVNCTDLDVANNSVGAWSGSGDAAIRASQLIDSRISGNQLSSALYGIVLSLSEGVHIDSNAIANTGFGPAGAALTFNDSSGLVVSGNDLRFARYGIIGIGGGDSSIISNNFSFATASAVKWVGFSNLTFSRNILWDSTVGFELTDGRVLYLTNNDAADSVSHCGVCYAGILTRVATGSTFQNNFSDNDVGIEATLVSNFSLTSNECYALGFCVLASSCSDVVVSGNVGSNLLVGAEVDSSVNVSLTANSFAQVIATGLVLTQDQNSTVDGNLVLASSGAVGIDLETSSGIRVTNNSIQQLMVGLEFGNSSDILVLGNAVGSSKEGFVLDQCRGLALFHNNFESDSGWRISGLLMNASWDGGYPLGGNYWSNASGTDDHSGPGQNIPGADGILDSPFPIAGYGEDRYPLSVPWSSPTVVVVAQGLPIGTSWSVNLSVGGFGSGGAALSTSGTQLSWLVPYGAWVPITYHVGGVSGFVPQHPTAQFTTDSGVTTVTVLFAPFTSTVSFEETGLTLGTNWSVTVGSVSIVGTGSSLTASLANGSYTYRVDAVAGYYPVPFGTFEVAGGSVQVAVAFTAVEFVLEFVEFGLPNGTTWRLSFNGLIETLTVPTFEFSVPNGTYDFRVLSVSGYSVSPANGSVLVQGSPTVIRLEFTAPPPPPPATPPPPSHLLDYELAGLASAFGALAALGWVVAYRRRRLRSDRDETPQDSVEASGAEESPGSSLG